MVPLALALGLSILSPVGVRQADAYCVYSTPNVNRLQWPAGPAIALTVDPSGADGLGFAATFNTIIVAVGNWNTTPAAPRWTYGVAAGAGNPLIRDGVSVLGFRDLSILGFTPNTYGATCIWYVAGGPNDGTITEIGIALNTDPARTWTWAAPLADNQVDVNSIALHELGHGLGLAHSNPDGLGACAEGLAFADAGPVMQCLYSRFAADNPNRMNRVLRPDDIAGNSLPAIGEVFKDEPPRATVIQWRLLRGGRGRVGVVAGAGAAPFKAAATSYYLYPGACTDMALGTWAPHATPVVDDLNTYAVATTGDYTPEDLSASAIGTSWSIVGGNLLPTSDACSPNKTLAADHLFFGGDPVTFNTIPGSYPSIMTCEFPIPAGTGSVVAKWLEYDDMPRASGWVQDAEYRFAKGGSTYDWRPISTAGDLRTGAGRAWSDRGYELPEAAGAAWVQLRFSLQCVPFLAVDHKNCAAVPVGLLYDDFSLEVTPGTPVPTFGIFSGSLAQTTFIDGTMLGVNCTAIPCWPGIRGTQNGLPNAINDNVNSPLGDSMTVVIKSAFGVDGNGVNWASGFDKTVAGGMALVHANPGFVAGFGPPEVFYRLYDPATKTWSPWDDSQLDADDVEIVAGVPVVMDSRYRWDWPPRDKVAAGALLPGGFTINGVAAYGALSFLPRGTRLQYFFKAVDVLGGVATTFSSDQRAYEVEDIPVVPPGLLPVGPAPDILEFDVLPRVYPPGAAGTLLAGKTNTPVLNLDGAYSAWSFGQDPVTLALRGMGVRADRYRLLQGLGEGANIGGHELPGQRIDLPSNYFPNLFEYPIKDSLTTWYRIIIQSGHLSGDWTVLDEQDANLLTQWLNSETGTNGGDRCLLVTGDDAFDALLNPQPGMPGAEQTSLAQNQVGVFTAIPAWSGTITTPYPVINDRFADPASGPALGAIGAYNYPLDGGCAGPNRFDGLTVVASPDAFSAATYPGAVPEQAAVARMSERDAVPDNDRSKGLGYGYSIQFIRKTGIPTTAANYAHSGVSERMQVLYKFLTSCRGIRAGAAQCWPCPSGPVLPVMGAGINRVGTAAQASNWATDPVFQTGIYGPLYAIQDNTKITGVPEEGPGAPAYGNALSQNRPNPFNPETVIPYSLAIPGRVTIQIFNVAGQCIRTLVDANQSAGPHVVRWNGQADGGRTAANGIFFYRITYPDGTTSAKKMAILR
jgi:hypothetical protein